jgi:hypothetical protein
MLEDKIRMPNSGIDESGEEYGPAGWAKDPDGVFRSHIPNICLRFPNTDPNPELYQKLLNATPQETRPGYFERSVDWYGVLVVLPHYRCQECGEEVARWPVFLVQAWDPQQGVICAHCLKRKLNRPLQLKDYLNSALAKPANFKDPEYVRFTEENDWEGETWNFYIPVAGNQEALEKLQALIKEDSGYFLDFSVRSESEVDTLCACLDDCDGYMPKHQKLSGLLILPTEVLGEDLDSLYKGGICNFMEAQNVV